MKFDCDKRKYTVLQNAFWLKKSWQTFWFLDSSFLKGNNETSLFRQKFSIIQTKYVGLLKLDFFFVQI